MQLDPIYLDCEQNSPEWLETRLGIVTASQAKRIITPQGRLSKSRDAYLAELLAEWALGEPVKQFTGDYWVERGNALEDDAFRYYAFHTDQEPEKIGFVYRDASKLCGCSPDGLVGDDGLLELKVPMSSTHLLYLARGVCPSEYVMQCQFQLFITGRSWVDFCSFHPELPPFIFRVMPDPMIQESLEDHIHDFINELITGRERLKSLGVVPFKEGL